MELFPAIDLLGGKAVRLFRGDYEQATVYSDAPLETAKSFKQSGARYLHLVDLDGARDGSAINVELIRRLVTESGLEVELGGGIRDMAALERYLSLGLMRAILGTAAVDNAAFLKHAVALYGEKIAVAVDVRDGFVATHGWQKTSAVSCFDFCQSLQDLGVKTVIVTDISKDGTMTGSSLELYEKLTARFTLDVIASGGVSSIDELRHLSAAGLKGAILGKALYTGAIDLAQALRSV